MTRALRAQELWARPAEEPVTAAVVSRVRGDAVLGLEDGSVLVLDRRGDLALRTSAEDGPVRAVAVTDNGQAFAAAHDECVSLWNRHGRRLDRLPLPRVEALDLRDRDGTLFAASGRRLVAVGRGRDHSPLEELPFLARSVRAGDEGWAVAAANESGQMAVYDEELRLHWQVALRGATGPATGDVRARLLLLPSRELGVCAFDPEGDSLGVYETPTASDTAVAQRGGERLLVADVFGGLYLMTRERGLCVWREEGRGPLLALGLGERHIVTVDARGETRCLVVGPGQEGRARFFEMREEARTPERAPALDLPLPPSPGRFTGRIAVSRDGRWIAGRIGSTLTVWDRSGAVLGQSEVSTSTTPLWGADRRLFLVRPREIEAWDVPEGRAWDHRASIQAVSTGDHSDEAAYLDDLGRLVVLGAEGSVRWSYELPEPPVSVHADEGMEAVGACGLQGGFYLLDGEGRPLWKRELPGGCRVLLAGRHVYLAERGGSIACYGYGEHRDWRTRTDAAVSQLFREGERAFLATEDNRFYRIDPEEGPTLLDRHAAKGRSRLVAGAGGAWRELHLHRRRLTCYDLEGTILWRADLPGEPEEVTLTSGPGLVAFVAGNRLLAFRLDRDEEEPALEGRYLEL